jgi:hypothetical protein
MHKKSGRETTFLFICVFRLLQSLQSFRRCDYRHLNYRSRDHLRNCRYSSYRWYGFRRYRFPTNGSRKKNCCSYDRCCRFLTNGSKKIRCYSNCRCFVQNCYQYCVSEY